MIKSLRLARTSRSSRAKDRDARPNADELRRLNELIRRPRRQFSAEEKHLLQRFRWSLTEQPGALTKFLHAVEWSDLEERNHAIELLGQWSPVDIDDALELLSKDFRGIREVRRHAVERLEKASDADLELYLLQLVQALRYEPAPHDAVDETTMPSASESSPTARARLGSGGTASFESAARTGALTWFLISRAVRSRSLATRFFWYLMAETEDRERGALFGRILQQFMDALQVDNQEFKAIKNMLDCQVALQRKLLHSLQYAKAVKRDRIEKKVERFRHALVSEEPEQGRSQQTKLDLIGGLGEEGIPLPVDPTISLLRVLPEQCSLLKSAMCPAVLACEVRHIGDTSGSKKSEEDHGEGRR